MNVLWIAGIAILVLLEKVVPTGRLYPSPFGRWNDSRRFLPLLFGMV